MVLTYMRELQRNVKLRLNHKRGLGLVPKPFYINMRQKREIDDKNYT